MLIIGLYFFLIRFFWFDGWGCHSCTVDVFRCVCLTPRFFFFWSFACTNSVTKHGTWRVRSNVKEFHVWSRGRVPHEGIFKSFCVVGNSKRRWCKEDLYTMSKSCPIILSSLASSLYVWKTRFDLGCVTGVLALLFYFIPPRQSVAVISTIVCAFFCCPWVGSNDEQIFVVE